MKYKILIGIFVIVTVMLAAILYMAWMPPYDYTTSTMSVIKRRIIIYAHINNQLPRDLSSLPKIEGKSNRILDGWGRPILYHIDEKNGVVTLKSLGESGDPTCKGSKPCIIRKFRPKTEEGQWADELTDWIRDSS